MVDINQTNFSLNVNAATTIYGANLVISIRTSYHAVKKDATDDMQPPTRLARQFTRNKL